MLRLQIVSDTHIEFIQGNEWNWDDIGILVPEGNALALLGDIGVCTSPREKSQLESFLSWCCERFEHVLYLAGNHEFYNLHKDSSKIEVDAVIGYLSSLENLLPNYHFLHNTKIELNGVTILGTTLWTSIPNGIAADIVGDSLNDYHISYHDGRQLMTSDTNAWHNEAVAFLDAELSGAAGPVVVLTHHTPSMIGTSEPKYERAKGLAKCVNHGFSSDLLPLIDKYSNLRVWCYGHTHYNNQQMRGSTLLASNQRGYSHDISEKYRQNYVITVCDDYTEDANRNRVWNSATK